MYSVGDAILHHGDCFEVMKTMEDNSVDMILCDPPYETVNWKSPHEWDKVLPFDLLWENYWRLLKPKGAIALFGNDPFSTLLKMSQLQYFKYDYVWKKSKAGGFANAKVKPLKTYELISIFSQGTTSPGRLNNMPYYPQGLLKIDKKVKPTGKSRLGITVRDNAPSEYVQEFTNYPNDFLEFASESGIHPTQKPVPLLEHLIKTYTLPDMVVMDNCAGSFSTGVAALKTGRKFIGIEKNEEYFNLGVDRMKQGEAEVKALR
jgi:site-specific DNA-methyltransferase (adenine-specific)